MFPKVGILGLGVMGGSLLLDLKKHHPQTQVTILARKESSRQWALDQGCDSAVENLSEFPEDLDLLVICIPVPSFQKALQGLHFKSTTLFTDVASTKSQAIPLLKEILGDRPYCSSHPMAGSEKTGLEGVKADLYHNRKVVLTPHDKQSAKQVPALTQFWESLGSKVVVMDPEKHDRSVAWVSHMPHLAIAGLVNAVNKAHEGDCQPFSIAGTGMRDISRLAASNPELWTDIVMDNLDEVRSAFDGLCHELKLVQDNLKSNNTEEVQRTLLEFFSKAKQTHQDKKLGL